MVAIGQIIHAMKHVEAAIGIIQETSVEMDRAGTAELNGTAAMTNARPSKFLRDLWAKLSVRGHDYFPGSYSQLTFNIFLGRGGSQITDLQTRSSSRIKVTKDTEGDETFIKIFGDDSAIQKAKELIDELTVDKAPRAPPTPVYETPKEPAQSVQEWDSKTTSFYDYLKECDARIEAEWNALPPIIKNFYQEHPEVTAMTEEEVEAFRLENNNIVVDRTFQTENSRPVPKPVKTFEHAFHNYPEILDEIRKAGFEKPSPIQSQCWPVLLSGEDLIGIAQTGTGKTLGFLLPALIHIDGQTVPREERGGPAVLIMAPTRELALQIDKEVKKYFYRNISSVCVYGGGARKEQIDVVSRGVDIVIATPGRMNDLNQAGHLNVRSVTYVVLDEADRMLDMGFEPQIRKVMYSLRPTKQCIMTSATWPPGVRRLADSYMKDPIQIYVGSLDLAATHSVTQTIQLIEENDKEQAFMDFIYNMGPDDKVIVFCGTKAKADYLSVECVCKNIICASLHGNRDQSDREQAVQDIGDGTVRILIATDVASRGLDIDDITHVLNYDFPKNIEEYVHRVGRTGRAGKTGESISYVTKSDWAQAAELVKILEEAQQFVPEEIYSMASRYEAMKERKERAGESVGRKPRFGGGRRY
ncbi:hypothetical protein D910_09940 [Dendroctonus ponderosae]|uniref:RNA helicase n=1 Tax=Dendroctonus ponderosae TaxID=77166 RepID=U4UHX0_DENPD|nr:hypothetical protein D910_09940 [Dendroctonus ponderosae]